MSLSFETIGLLKKYIQETLAGAGALEGVPCQIQSIVPITGGHRVTYLWEDNDGVSHTSTMDVMDGAKGDKGDKGDRGEIGATGPQGAQGIQGIQGPQGVAGQAGPQGIQGIQGIQGEKGDDGYPFLIYKQYDDISEFNAADFPEIGLMFMVMTEDYDPEDPTQSIGFPIYRYTGTGTPPYSLVVHLASQGIKGDKGDKGDTGAQGIQGPQGEKGDKGDKGDTGAQGPQGPQGVGMPDGGTAGQMLVKDTNADYDYSWHTMGTSVSKDATDSVRPGNHGLVESNAVYAAINNALSSIYTPHGDLTCAELTSELLIAANVGNVYNMTDSGTTSALFIQGAGTTISAGDSVGIIRAGQDSIMYNYMGNVFDLTEYQKKELTIPLTIGGQSQTEVEGALGALNTAKAEKTALDNEISTRELLGAHNLLKFPYNQTTGTDVDVQWTVNKDGSLVVNTTTTTAAQRVFHCFSNSNNPMIFEKDVILTGCPANGSADKYFLSAGIIENGTTRWVGDFGEGLLIEANTPITAIYPGIAAGQTVSNLKFYPMLRYADDVENYRPYAPVNVDCLSADANAELGAHQLIPMLTFEQLKSGNTAAAGSWNGNVYSMYGMTYTVNSDMSITVNGTATSNSYLNFGPSLPVDKGKKYKLSGAKGNAKLFVGYEDNGWHTIGTDVGDGVIFTNTFSKRVRMGVTVDNGETVNNLKVYPLLTSANDTSDAITPATMTNQQLTRNMIYLTEEVDTGKVWINSKPIYRKVVNCGTVPNSTSKTVNHDIANVEMVVGVGGVAFYPTSKISLPLPYVGTISNQPDKIAVWVDSTKIYLGTHQDMSAYTAYVVIEYTKTTD